MQNLTINANYHGPMSHPYNITRLNSNTDYIKQILIHLNNHLKEGIDITEFVKTNLDSKKYIINDINSRKKIKLYFDIVVYGGATCEKWLSVLDKDLYDKFIKLYPTEDIDINLVCDHENFNFNFNYLKLEQDEEITKKKKDISDKELVSKLFQMFKIRPIITPQSRDMYLKKLQKKLKELKETKIPKNDIIVKEKKLCEKVNINYTKMLRLKNDCSGSNCSLTNIYRQIIDGKKKTNDKILEICKPITVNGKYSIVNKNLLVIIKDDKQTNFNFSVLIRNKLNHIITKSLLSVDTDTSSNIRLFSSQNIKTEENSIPITKKIFYIKNEKEFKFFKYDIYDSKEWLDNQFSVYKSKYKYSEPKILVDGHFKFKKFYPGGSQKYHFIKRILEKTKYADSLNINTKKTIYKYGMGILDGVKFKKLRQDIPNTFSQFVQFNDTIQTKYNHYKNKDTLKYDNLTLVLIGQLSALENKLTDLQAAKCRIRYARLYYLIKAIERYESSGRPIPKEWIWPPKVLIDGIKKEIIKPKYRYCRSIDIEIMDSTIESMYVPDYRRLKLDKKLRSNRNRLQNKLRTNRNRLKNNLRTNNSYRNRLKNKFSSNRNRLRNKLRSNKLKL